MGPARAILAGPFLLQTKSAEGRKPCFSPTHTPNPSTPKNIDLDDSTPGLTWHCDIHFPHGNAFSNRQRVTTYWRWQGSFASYQLIFKDPTLLHPEVSGQNIEFL